MVRRHNQKELFVFLYGNPIGMLRLNPHGMLSFQYDSVNAPSISVALPNDGTTTYQGEPVRTWFDGVLPDNFQTRISMCKDKPYGSHSTFGLLSDYGLDLPGAIQVSKNEFLDDTDDVESEYVAITEDDIGKRLDSMIELCKKNGGTHWHVPGEHWSLAGGQPKIALREFDGEYYECHGAAASNVIIKPGVINMTGQSELEYACMKIAAETGMWCAETSFQTICGTDVLVSRRYDRDTAPDGTVRRFHQEDMCQALGVTSERKYFERNNPTTAIINLLDSSCSRSDTMIFADMVLFNYLIGATDAHLKNHALLHGKNGEVSLAPMYDVASIFPYKTDIPVNHVAMPIGTEKRIGRVGKKALSDFAASLGIPSEILIQRHVEIAGRIADKAPKVLSQLPDTETTQQLVETFLPRLLYHCETSAENVQSAKFTRPDFDKAGRFLYLDGGTGGGLVDATQLTDADIFGPSVSAATNSPNGQPRPLSNGSAMLAAALSAEDDGDVWVEGHMRGKVFVKGHWRHRPGKGGK